MAARLNEPLSRVRDRLESVDRMTDWSRCSKYLRWLKVEDTTFDQFAPLTLFKAMLVLHWHAYTAPEYDHVVEDSAAIRKFIGVAHDELAPGHHVISSFRRLLVERGVISDLLAELNEQFIKNGLLNSNAASTTAGEDVLPGVLYPLASDIRLKSPWAWTRLEAKFTEYWLGQATAGRDVNYAGGDVSFNAEYISQLPKNMKSNFVLLEVEGDAFRFKWIGEDLASANFGDLVGTKIEPRTGRKFRTTTQASLQDELVSICRAAIENGSPVATSTSLDDRLGVKQNIWAIFVPVKETASGILHLAGCIYAEPANFENRKIGSGASGHLSMLAEQIDPFSLDTDFRALGPLEWVEMENTFFEYWHQQRGQHKTPLIANIKLSDLSALAPHLTLIRVLKNSGYRYELVGEHIQIQNERDVTGQLVAEKLEHNIQAYGHGGLQRELSSVFSRAVSQLRPVGTNTYFANSVGARCQMWAVHAPLSDEFGQVCMLMGITYINKVSVN